MLFSGSSRYAALTLGSAARALLLALLVLAGPSWARPSLARVKVALAPVTAAADPASEQVTQVMLWDAVEVVSTRGAWANVLVREQYRTERGYPGWMKLEALELNPEPSGGAWVAAVYPQVVLRARPDTGAPAVLQVPMSTRLPLSGGSTRGQKRDAKGELWYPVKLPGGDAAWVRAGQVQKEVEPTIDEGLQVVERARSLEDTPYLWGGMSRTGIDCSGLTYVSYRLNGVTIPRDADQQYQVGEAVLPDELRAGDLVFFGEPGEITHVGMYVGQGTFVHASSGAGVMVSPLFEGWYKQYYRGARRILKESAGGTRVLTPQP